MMKIAVTGAFSYSGKYITRRLLKRGAHVITLTGHPHRPNPFGGSVEVFPLDFADEVGLASSLAGVAVLVNTYWIRFDQRENTQARAVENTRALVRASQRASVKRLVHISITNPSPNSPLPYFSGKAANESIIRESGLSYAILRPTVLFGPEDILINNIAYLLRRLPLFGIPGDGKYLLQPVYVDDVAEMAVESIYEQDSYTNDAVGPETFTFEELVGLISQKIGAPRLLIHIPPAMALLAAQLLSVFLGDRLLTPEELSGLMANLLVSDEAPRGTTRFSDWLESNKQTLGARYASELARHYS